MPSRASQGRKKEDQSRMSAAHLLSFQANLYSQTDITSKPATRSRSHFSSTKHSEQPTEALTNTIAHEGYGKGPSSRSNKCRQSHIKRPGEQKKKWARGVALCEMDDMQDGEKVTDLDLNWQQASLLQNKQTLSKSDLPGWTQGDSPTTMTGSKSGSGKRRVKKKGGAAATSKSQLPPLRFSSNEGKSAWKFVLPTPRAGCPSDMPNWFDAKSNDIVVTLGSRRSSSDSSSSTLSTDEADDKQDGTASLNDGTLPPFTTFSPGRTTKASREAPSNDLDLVNKMVTNLSIYAGPSFSASAPQPCHLPMPSFLLKA